ncbi:hypothetical protein VHEMI02953 [[Torrubiella] hemipterigena]|uniref:Uncharacterized protein n=1 Tax=[Torrubiella] hemipterigena TaxID=1531966 RepID=A0A0A1T9D8_9HYPO|nr:hypothetical protein VHEMI02953 [[Torrubiella] hemipterigena]
MTLDSVLLYTVPPASIILEWPDADKYLSLPHRNRGRLLYSQSRQTHGFLVYWTKAMDPSVQNKPWFNQLQHVEIEIDSSNAFYTGGYADNATPFLWAEPQLKRLQTLTIVFSRAHTFDQVIQDPYEILEGSNLHWLCNWWIRYDGWYDPPEGRPKASFYARVISCDTGPEEWLTPENYKEKRIKLDRQLEEFRAHSARTHLLYQVRWDYERNPPGMVGWDLVTYDEL